MMLTLRESQGTRWYTFKPLDELGIFTNWITTRLNGFNLASSTTDETARENLAFANRLFAGGRTICLPKQVHGTEIYRLSGDPEKIVPADAVIMSAPFTPAGVLTADCLPIILADPKQKKAAIVHAGRMGIFLGIIGKTLARMGSGGDVVAAIGPSIRKCCYEVKEDVFEGGFDFYRKYFADGKLDMAGAAFDQLLAAGVAEKNVHDCGICTSCRVDEFYSHRAEKGNAGRFMTGVMISPKKQGGYS